MSDVGLVTFGVGCPSGVRHATHPDVTVAFSLNPRIDCETVRLSSESDMHSTNARAGLSRPLDRPSEEREGRGRRREVRHTTPA